MAESGPFSLDSKWPFKSRIQHCGVHVSGWSSRERVQASDLSGLALGVDSWQSFIADLRKRCVRYSIQKLCQPFQKGANQAGNESCLVDSSKSDKANHLEPFNWAPGCPSSRDFSGHSKDVLEKEGDLQVSLQTMPCLSAFAQALPSTWNVLPSASPG